MEHRARLIQYWQRCLDYQACFKMTTLQPSPLFQYVELNENKSQILATDLQRLEDWLQNQNNLNQVFFIPEYGQHPQTQEIIFPYMLWVNIDAKGNLTPSQTFPFPIFSQRWFEGSLEQNWVLLTESKLTQYLQLNPMDKKQCTFADFLGYMHELQQTLLPFDWRSKFAEVGYPIEKHAIIGCVQHLPTYQSVECGKIFNASNPKQLTGRLLRENYLSAETDWMEENLFKYARPAQAHVSGEWALSKEQRAVVCQCLAAEEGQWLSVEAGYQSGKTTVFDEMIAHQWLDAALNGQTPPQVVHFDGTKLPKPYSIFHVAEKNASLSLATCQSFYQTGLKSNAFASEHIQQFLQHVKHEFQIEVSNLKASKEILLERLQCEVSCLHELNKLAHSYWEIKHHLAINYEKEGGVNQKLVDAEKNLAEHQAHIRHLQVLQSLWVRQCTQQSTVLSVLGLQSMLKKRQLARLKQLFAEYLPEEDIQGLSLTQMEKRIEALLTRSQQCGRSLQDSVFQLQTDLRQLQIAKKRYQQAIKQYLKVDTQSNIDMDTLVEKLDCQLRYRIFRLCQCFWQAELLLTAVWGQDETLKKHLIWDEEIANVDWLFIEHAEQYSIQDLLPFVAKAKKAVFMGQYDRAASTLVNQSIDFHLLELIDEFISETEFETLYYKGLLASGHGFYLSQEFSDLKPADLRLTISWRQPASIVAASHALGNLTVESHASLSGHANEQHCFNFVPVDGKSTMQLGSMFHLTEAKKMIDWLANFQIMLYQHAFKQSLNDLVTVVCATSGQASILFEMVEAANLRFNNIHALCDLNTQATRWVLFSPVFTLDDPAPYLFNENKAALMKMVGQTLETFVLIGDRRLLNGHHHSPMGILAKFIKRELEEANSQPTGQSSAAASCLL